jgi:carbamoyl-phosphate synthase large subunit
VEVDVRVLITGMGHPLGHSIYKTAKQCAFPVDVTVADADARSVGLYLEDDRVLLPLARDASYIETLLDVLRDRDVQALFVGTTAEMSVVSAHAEYIEDETGARVLIEPPHVLSIANDKYETSRMLAAAGLEHARSARGDDLDACLALARACGYPLFAKPRTGSASTGAGPIPGEDELRAFAGPDRESWVVQEHLGVDSEYTSGVYRTLAGETIDVISMWRQLQFGLSYKVEVRALPEIDAYAVAVAEALAATGPVNVQAMLVEGRGPVCFEINPRLSSTSPVRAMFGLNEVELLLRERVLGERPAAQPHREGWAFRAWQEVYVPLDEVERLR